MFLKIFCFFWKILSNCCNLFGIINETLNDNYNDLLDPGRNITLLNGYNFHAYQGRNIFETIYTKIIIKKYFREYLISHEAYFRSVTSYKIFFVIGRVNCALKKCKKKNWWFVYFSVCTIMQFSLRNKYAFLILYVLCSLTYMSKIS